MLTPQINRRAYDKLEIIADASVHLAGIAIVLAAGPALVIHAALGPANEHLAALLLYIATFLGVLCVSLAFNIWPATAFKHYLARVDQAAIFLFIAATYTPFLTLLDRGLAATLMLAGVWGLALTGVALKLLIPQRFGRIAILLYLGIGWSGLLVFQDLSANISSAALLLLIAGGLIYSAGIIFHLWQRLRFHNAIWHLTVVIGATLHIGAVFEALVLNG